MLGIDTIAREALDTVRGLDLWTVDISYTRATAGSCIIMGAVKSPRATDNIAQANPVNFYLFDFIIRREDLNFGSGGVLPNVGDVIRTLNNGVASGEEYKVAKFYDNPHYTYRDPGQTQLRVHTQQTKQT